MSSLRHYIQRKSEKKMTQPTHAYSDQYGLRRYNVEGMSPNPISVTSLLRSIAPGTPLVKWIDRRIVAAALDAFQKSGDVKQATYIGMEARWAGSDEADFGSAVHLLTEQLDLKHLGLLDKIAPVADMKRASGFAKQWERLRDSFEMQIMAVECTLVNSKLGYAGTADRVVIIPALSDYPVILDVKTGKSVWSDAAAQCAGLAYCDKILYTDGTLEDIPWELDRRIAVAAHVKARSAQLIPLDIEKAWPIFEALPQLALWRAEQIEVLGEPLLPDEEAALRADLRLRISLLPPDLNAALRVLISVDDTLDGGTTMTWTTAQLAVVEDLFGPFEREARERLEHVIRLWGDGGEMELRAKVLQCSGRTSSVKELTAAEIDELIKTF